MTARKDDDKQPIHVIPSDSPQAAKLRQRLMAKEAEIEKLTADKDAVLKERSKVYSERDTATRAGIFSDLVRQNENCRKFDDRLGRRNTLLSGAYFDRSQIVKELQAVIEHDSRVLLAQANIAKAQAGPRRDNW